MTRLPRRALSIVLAAAIVAAWALAPGLTGFAQGTAHEPPRHECVAIQALDGTAPYLSDAMECAVQTAPASTFKVPHAVIALETGVVTNALEPVKWNGTRHPYPTWTRDHSLDSAMKWSVLWFFQRTATLIGRERMADSLKRLRYGSDSFERELTTFWLNGDLVISPAEQLEFLRRLVLYELPVARRHVDTVKAAFQMPPGTITNAAGEHAFGLTWPGLRVVRAKTGNATLGSERVSWIIGHIETNGRGHVFAARVRAGEALPSSAGADLALRVLNTRGPY
jgi:beta-lactamase class D